MKEGIFIFKKIRGNIIDIKKDFYEATWESEARVCIIFNVLVHFVIAIFIWIVGLVFYIFNLKSVAIVIGFFSVAYLIIACFTKLFKITEKFSCKLFFKLFGRYGKVVSRDDWKDIKKYWPREEYKEVISKKSCGYCYFYSWAIIQQLEDAQLMYCSQKINGKLTAHAVIVKNNCVYDTNLRRHFDYNQYVEFYDIVIYKMFSEKEYRTETFFDDIRPGFVEWCEKNNVYCNPQ